MACYMVVIRYKKTGVLLEGLYVFGVGIDWLYYKIVKEEEKKKEEERIKKEIKEEF